MSLALVQEQTAIITGLNSFTWTAPAAGLYKIRLQMSVTPQPGYSSGGAGVGSFTYTPGVASGISVAVTQNAGNIFTSPVFATSHKHFYQVEIPITCAAADAIVITLSSGASYDSLLNVIKTEVAINQVLLFANI